LVGQHKFERAGKGRQVFVNIQSGESIGTLKGRESKNTNESQPIADSAMKSSTEMNCINMEVKHRKKMCVMSKCTFQLSNREGLVLEDSHS
jgi:hypothetical protein